MSQTLLRKAYLFTLTFSVLAIQSHAQQATPVGTGLPQNFEVDKLILSNQSLFANVRPCKDKNCDTGESVCSDGSTESGLYQFDSTNNEWSLAIATGYGSTPKNSVGSVNGTGDLYQILPDGRLQRLRPTSGQQWEWETLVAIKEMIFPGHPAEFSKADNFLVPNTERIYGYARIPAKNGFEEHQVIWIYDPETGNLQYLLDEGIKRQFEDAPTSIAATSDGVIYLGYRWYARERAKALFDDPIMGTDENMQGNIFRYVPNTPFDYSSGEWQSGHQGLNQGNLTNGACCGPGRKIEISDDRNTLYYATEQANYSYNISTRQWELLTEANNNLYSGKQGLLFSKQGRKNLTIIDGALQTPVGTAAWNACIEEILDYHFVPGTDQQELLVATRSGCDIGEECATAFQTPNIWRINLGTIASAAGKVSNIHPTSLTYLGGPGDNEGIALAIAQPSGTTAPKLFVAGNFGKQGNPETIAIDEAEGNSPGVILQLNLEGTQVERLFALGDEVFDFEMNAEGKAIVAYRKESSYRVALLDITQPEAAQIQLLDPLEDPYGTFRVSVGTAGEAAALADKTLYFFTASGVMTTTDLRTNKPTSIFPSYVKDVAISSTHEQIYITGFDNKTCGNPVQVAFVIAYDFNLVYRWKTFGFDGSDMCGDSGNDMADTRGYRIHVGQDDKLYFAGESAGGNTAFRWDGTYTDVTGTNKQSTLVQIDEHTLATNTKSNHISYFAEIDHSSGQVLKGQLILARTSSLAGNTYRVRHGALHADDAGNVYVGATAAAFYGGRESMRLGGKLLGPYGSGPNTVHSGQYNDQEISFGDAVLYGVNTDFNQRRLWTGFTRNEKDEEYAAGTIVGIASGFGTTALLTVGSGHHWTTENAIAPEPFSPFDNTHNDTYLAVWQSDIAANANKDSLESKIIIGDFMKQLPEGQAAPGIAATDVYVYPNPLTDEMLTVEANFTIIYISIYNIAGQLVTEYPGLDAQNIDLDLSRLASGTYVLQIGGFSGIITKKLLKK
ncbi:MAG: T9SS type A sorting domain-containing protein [Bacteroidota bacterium]